MGKSLRRNNSDIDLSQLTAFSLPPSEMSKCNTKSKDDHTWMAIEEEQQQYSFDEVFFGCLEELTLCLIDQRLSKKQALRRMSQTFKACSPSRKGTKLSPERRCISTHR